MGRPSKLVVCGVLPGARVQNRTLFLLGGVSPGQSAAMRVVVTGATGNVGTSVLRALSADPAVDEIVALARRAPGRALEGAEFLRADVTTDDLAAVFRGADAVVHLAWLIQPGRDEALTR